MKRAKKGWRVRKKKTTKAATPLPAGFRLNRIKNPDGPNPESNMESFVGFFNDVAGK